MANQRGQAIVLIALMLTIVIGMAAIAIDGSRAYALRRDLQGAVDAAALAAGDNLQQTGNWSSAERAAASVFAANLRLYAAPACNPPWGAPTAAPYTVTCNYSDPNATALTVVAQGLGPQGSQFTISAQSNLQLQFARILTNGVSPALSATSSGGVGNLRDTPAVTALGQTGCDGNPGSTITLTTGGDLSVVGDMVSLGVISVGAAALTVAGDLYARCQAVVPGNVTIDCYPSGNSTPCTPPDVAGATRTGFFLHDPRYPAPAVGGMQPMPGTDVTLHPGVFSADPAFASNRCYFLASGVYEWQGGYTNNAGFVSNELKPPDEPVSGNNTALGHQMWDTGGANCAGAFQVTAAAGIGIQRGTWAVEVTATRTDIYNGVNYARESAPSMCRTVSVDTGQLMKVTISNVPGATGYNVYASPPSNGCNGPFGYAGSITGGGAEHNDNTAACPAFSGTACSLGNVSGTFDGTVLSALWAPNAFVSPGVLGAYPPSGETPPLHINLPNQNPDRATPPAGDRANENQCSTIVGATASCPAAVTPGAVEFYIPSTGCLNATTNADNFLFGGYQYNWVLVYEPGALAPPANTCSNVLGAAADSAWVGLIYMPSAALTVSKAATFRTEATGGLMANTITFTGQLPTIIYSSAYAPVPPATRLTL